MKVMTSQFLSMMSPTKFYDMIQIILWMCSFDQSLVTLAFLWEKLSKPQFYKDLTRKTVFFEGWSWFKFNNLGLTLGTNLKFYTSLSKGLKLKVRKFWGLIPTFVEVTGEKLVGEAFLPPPILNRVNSVQNTPILKLLAVVSKIIKRFGDSLSWKAISADVHGVYLNVFIF